jgi:carboxymethylenebutenolidase
MNRNFLLRPLALAALCVLSSVALHAQDWAKARLENTPRHLEWVKVKQGNRTIETSVAYPEVKDKATAVVVIHEIFGLTDWARGVTDQLAEAGYIAVAPDLLSGMGPNGGATESFGGGDAVRKAITSLPPEQVTADLNAIAEYVSKLPACNGKVVVAGFCWGGTQSFRAVTKSPIFKASYVFYGTGPENPEEITQITAPVYGFYGGNDNRVNATIKKTEELMRAAQKKYEPVIYDGAGHGFMRAGEAPDANAANKKAREDAWKRWKDLLKQV